MQRSILTLRGPVPPQVEAARWRVSAAHAGARACGFLPMKGT